MLKTIQVKHVALDGQIKNTLRIPNHPFIRQFLDARSLNNQSQQVITGLTLRVLRHDLLQEIERLRTEGLRADGQPIISIELQQLYNQIDSFIQTTLKKGDRLIIANPQRIVL